MRHFNRFWPYPELSRRILPLIPSPEDQKVLLGLIEVGEVEPIERWSKAYRSEKVSRLIELGLRNPDEANDRFDEIKLGTRILNDGCGSCDFLLCRRVGARFLHRVYYDGSGDTVYEFEAEKPLTRREFVRMSRYPAPWEDCGFDEMATPNTIEWNVYGRQDGSMEVDFEPVGKYWR